MSGEMLTGQATPGESQTATTEAAQSIAATATAQTDGAEGGEGNPQSPATKTFTQKELDDIVKRAKAAAESKAERRVLRTLERLQPQAFQQPPKQSDQQQPSADGKPTRKEGEADDAYLDRLTDWKLEQRERKEQAERQQAQQRTLAKKTEGIYAQAEKLGDDFDRESFDEHLTKPIAEALVESDDAARLMHFLGSNSEEMQRIAQLSPARQAAELGKLEAKLAAAAEAEAKNKPPALSKAPQALQPVKQAGAKGAPDPKDSAAWIRYQNERERARLRGN
jgi:hypothetical protein